MTYRLVFLSVLLIYLATGCESSAREELTNPVSAPFEPANSTHEEPGSIDEAVPGMELEGMFRYMADAALFQDCRNGRTYPVSMEARYIQLERAYLDSGVEPGSELMVSLRGRLLSRPPMEGNLNIIKLIVDKLNDVYPHKTCAPVTHADLAGTFWRLIELGNSEVFTAGGVRAIHMVLATGETQVRGFAGCNNFFGRYETSDGALSFSAIGATKMACPGGMDTEQAFLLALGATTRYQISGLYLELYAGDQRLARLEATYL